MIMYHQVVGACNGFFQTLEKLKKILIDNHYKTLVKSFWLPKNEKYFLDFTQGVFVTRLLTNIFLLKQNCNQAPQNCGARSRHCVTV